MLFILKQVIDSDGNNIIDEKYIDKIFDIDKTKIFSGHLVDFCGVYPRHEPVYLWLWIEEIKEENDELIIKANNCTYYFNKLERKNDLKNYFIADLHLGHYNAMTRFDNRPFKTLDEMDTEIINNINEVVGKNDNLYLLGDLSWYDGQKTYELLSKIKCKNLHLIVGNHDGKWMRDQRCANLFSSINDLLRIRDNGRVVILCHYPMAVWDQSHNGSYHLYGHVHRNLNPDGDINHAILKHDELRNAYNVGCMIYYMNYTPRTLDEIIKKSKRKQK